FSDEPKKFPAPSARIAGSAAMFAQLELPGQVTPDVSATVRLAKTALPLAPVALGVDAARPTRTRAAAREGGRRSIEVSFRPQRFAAARSSPSEGDPRNAARPAAGAGGGQALRLRHVDVFLHGAVQPPGVGPGHVRLTAGSQGDPHVVAEEPGLDR